MSGLVLGAREPGGGSERLLEGLFQRKTVHHAASGHAGLPSKIDGPDGVVEGESDAGKDAGLSLKTDQERCVGQVPPPGDDRIGEHLAVHAGGVSHQVEVLEGLPGTVDPDSHPETHEILEGAVPADPERTGEKADHAAFRRLRLGASDTEAAVEPPRLKRSFQAKAQGRAHAAGPAGETVSQSLVFQSSNPVVSTDPGTSTSRNVVKWNAAFVSAFP